MKKLINKIAILTLVLGVVGCREKYDTVGGQDSVSVYMDKEYLTVNLTEKGGETFIEPRTSIVAQKDVQVTVSAEDFFEAYNKKHKTQFEMLPASEYELYEVSNPSNVSTNGRINVTIKEGKYSSKIGLRIKGLDEKKYPFGVRYAIPLKITSSSADLLSQKESVVTFNRPFKTSLPFVKRTNRTQVQLDPKIPSFINKDFTVQAHYIFTSLTTTNQTTINIQGYYYTRALLKTPEGSIGGIQVKDGSADGDATFIQKPMETNKWYQITYVYQGNEFRVYLNGELVKTFIRFNLGAGTDDEKRIVWAGNTDYSADHYVRELRIWNKALTEAEIKENLYLPVNPNSEGLIMYLPLNEEVGFKDVTKWDNKVLDQPKPGGFEWIRNVKFPAEKLEIEK